jgi:branched-chain amino acid transport system substrate-binding protein
LPKRFWASALTLTALVVAGCNGGEEAGDAMLTVYVSLSPGKPDGRDAAEGAQMALADAGGEAAGVPVESRVLDDMPGGGWSPQGAAANARTATQDSTAIAYLGDFESGATRASLPVTNEARLLQVSPASAADDLVDDDAEERTFGRVIPGDEAQAEAGAEWVRMLGFERAVTDSDGSEYGDSMVREFETTLGPLGGGVEGLLYFAGLPAARPPAPGRSQTLMVTDASLGWEAAGYATSAALDPTQLPAAGQGFAKRFEAEHGRLPGRYAAYGYEAMAVILDSIERSADPLDRSSVVDAFFETADRDSILGTYSIDEEGNTTLDRMTGYEVGAAGPPEPAAELTVP